MNTKNEEKRYFTKYIHQFNDEDLQLIAENCLSDEYHSNTKIKRTWFNEENKNILVILEDGREFYIEEVLFDLISGYKTRFRDGYRDWYISFCYERFGEEFVYDYFLGKNDVPSLEYELKKAEEKLRKAQNRCKKEIETFLSVHVIL